MVTALSAVGTLTLPLPVRFAEANVMFALVSPVRLSVPPSVSAPSVAVGEFVTFIVAVAPLGTVTAFA